jgi:putative ABC transport system permease protein
MRSVLVAAEVALAVIVLIGAGLLVKSFVRLQEVNPGFDSQNLLTVHAWLSDPKYEQAGPTAAFLKELVGRLGQIPGVQAVGVADSLPIRGANILGNPVVEGREPDPPGNQPLIGIHAVNADYFRAMGIRLLKGRAFTERDVEGTPPVTIVSETTARRLWPGEDPVGKRLKYVGPDTPWSEVVGVVGDVKYDGLNGPPGIHCYAPHLQMPLPYMAISLRSKLEVAALTAVVQREVQAMQSGLPIYEIKTMDEVIAESIAGRRLLLSLFSVFAAVALLLTVVGIYGVVSYTAAQRTHEMGVRMALGAQRSDVLKLIVVRGLLPVLVGLVVGSAGAFALLRLTASLTTSLLFEVSASDPLTFTLIALLLLVVAGLSCYLPARRVAKVDPLAALRYE